MRSGEVAPLGRRRGPTSILEDVMSPEAPAAASRSVFAVVTFQPKEGLGAAVGTENRGFGGTEKCLEMAMHVALWCE